MAGWQSGYAAACKAVHSGSIPDSASINYLYVKSKKKQELNLKPGTSKDFKELKESLDFDIE